MISRNLSERLKRLEARVMPTGAPTVITVEYITKEGEVTSSYLVEVPCLPDLKGRRHGWRNANISKELVTQKIVSGCGGQR